MPRNPWASAAALICLCLSVSLLGCGGGGGSTTQQSNSTVTQPPPPLSVTLSASSTSVSAGTGSTLSWTAQSAVSATLDHGVGTVPLTGTITVWPTVTTTYAITATDVGGKTATSQVTLNVTANTTLNASVRHIIFLVQENHSFDSYFSRMNEYRASRGVGGTVDQASAATALADAQRTAVPRYHFNTVCTENVGVTWNDSHIAVDGGGMDDFMLPYANYPSTIDPWYHRTMGYYDDRDLPFYYELATQFGTSDAWFSPVLAPTVLNRMYLFAGTSFGHIDANDKPPSGGWTQKTIFDVLQSAGVDWRYYYQDSNGIFLAQFASYQNSAIRARIRPLSEYFTILSSATADQDLPQVIFIERPSVSELDEHPGSNVQLGATWAAQSITALMASTAWSSSIFVLTWDEGGGFYDHVPPAQVQRPDNVAPMFKSGDQPGSFAQTGFRVPVVVVSPWARPQYVSHTVRDYTSILKLIETRFSLPPLTWRDEWASPMLEFFDFDDPPPWLVPPPLPPQPTTGVCDATQEIS